MDQQLWDEFVKKEGSISGSFLQSWKWGEFQKKVGKKIIRDYLLNDQKEIVALYQSAEKQIPFFGKIQFIFKGPLFFENQNIEWFLKSLKKDSSFFIHTEPKEQLQVSGFCVKNLQPQNTLITNLSSSQEDLLQNMHEKTRYNIKLSQKKSLVFEKNSMEFEKTWEIFEQTAKRDGFRLHSKKYYQKMIESKVAFLSTVEFNGEILCANIMLDWNKTRTYLHGASSNSHRNLMPTYFLHWNLMLDAKREGFIYYDWWGIAPDFEKNHKWTGITKFKCGFGGEKISFPNALVFCEKPMIYRFYQLIQKIRSFV